MLGHLLDRGRSLVLRVLETLVGKEGRGPGPQEPQRRYSLVIHRRTYNLNKYKSRRRSEAWAP